MVNVNELMGKIAGLNPESFGALCSEMRLLGLLGITPEHLLALKEMAESWPRIKVALMAVPASEQGKPSPSSASTYENILKGAGLDKPVEKIRFGREEGK